MAATTFVRHYSLLALGVVLLAIGAVPVARPAPSAEWTAYAPLSHATFAPIASLHATSLAGAALRARDCVPAARCATILVTDRPQEVTPMHAPSITGALLQGTARD